MPKITVKQLKKDLFLLHENLLKQNNLIQKDTLKHKSLLAYYDKVVKELSNILLGFDSNEQSELNKLSEQLKQYLISNWEMINGTVFCYTALPDDKITLFLCDIAQFIQENSEKNSAEDNSTCLLKLLMPTVNTESLLSISYPNLDNEEGDDFNLKDILKSHILGRKGAYLIPVTQFIHLLDTLPKEKEWLNYYYDYCNQIHTDNHMERLTQEEYERLASHSDTTEALYQAQIQFNASLQTQDNLLIKLKSLCDQLYFYSVDGVGTETDAGNGVYSAIIQFDDYYRNLEEETKQKIPREVKQEIDLLLELSSNSERNRNATETINTCIATRRKDLQARIKLHEDTLFSIGLSEEKQAIFIKQKKQDLLNLKEEFNQKIKDNTYCGYDKLYLTKQLVNNLIGNYSISSLDDLQEFIQLTPDEITDFCQEDRIRTDLTSQFSTIENFIAFLIDTPAIKLQVILSACQKEFVSKFNIKFKDIPLLLMILDQERCRIVCQAMKNTFSNLITTSKDFMKIVNALNNEKLFAVCEIFKERLPRLIKKDAYNFSSLLQNLTTEQRTIIYDSMKDQLPNMIKTAFDVNAMLKYLNLEQRMITFNDIENKLDSKMGRLIRHTLSFKVLLEFLPVEQRTTIYEGCKKKLPQQINSHSSLIDIVAFLTFEQYIEVLNAIKNELPDLIRTVKEFLSLTIEQRKVFYTKDMKDFWSESKVITGSCTFNELLSQLGSDERISVYEALKDRLPHLIHSIIDFNTISKCLMPAQCTEISISIQDKIPHLINNINEFTLTFKRLTLEQRVLFYEGIKTNLPKFIKNIADLSIVLKLLPTEQSLAFYNETKNDLMNKIFNKIDDFISALKSFPPDYIEDGYLLKKGFLEDSSYFNNRRHVINILESLIEHDTERCNSIYKGIRNCFKVFINNTDELLIVLQYFRQSSVCLSFCTAMKKELIELIGNNEEFTKILTKLDDNQRTALSTTIQSDEFTSISSISSSYRENHNRYSHFWNQSNTPTSEPGEKVLKLDTPNTPNC